MRRHASLHILVIANFLALPCRSYFGEYKVLISHSHGSEIGEETAFEAEVVLKPKAHSRDLGQTENIIYEFSWKVTDLEWIRQNKTTHRWNSFRWRWFSEGQKTVFVFVRIIVGTEYNSRNSSKRKQSQSGHTEYYARNHTQITVYGTEGICFVRLKHFHFLECVALLYGTRNKFKQGFLFTTLI